MLAQEWPQQALPRIFPACPRVRHPAYFPNEHGDDLPLSWSHVERTHGLDTRAAPLPSLAAELAETTTELAPPRAGSLPAAEAWRLVDAVLAEDGESRCWFGVWEGFACLDNAFPDEPGRDDAGRAGFRNSAQRLSVRGREYVVLRGSVYLAARPLCEQQRQSVNLWWPPSGAWCVHTDIELDSTLVAGSRALVDRVLADPWLEADELCGGADPGAAPGADPRADP